MPAAQAIRRRARVIRQNRWMIAGITAVFAVVGSITRPEAEPRFLTGAMIDTGGIQEQVLLVYEFAAKPETPKIRIARDAETALSPQVLRNAAVRLGGIPRDVEVTAGAGGFSGRIGIAVEADEPRQAARVANVVAEEVVKDRNEEYRARLDLISSELRRQRRQAGIPPANLDVLASLLRYSTAQYQTRIDMLKSFASPAIVAQRASIPTGPVFTLPWGGMIAIFGFSIALVAAFVREALRSRREDPDLAAALAGVEPLGILDRSSPTVLTSYVRGTDSDAELVLVCGVRPGDRPLAAAAVLATGLSAQGHRVALVEADAAHPRLARLLRVEPEPGLTELADGTASAEDALRPTVDANGLPGPVALPAGSARRTSEAAISAALARLGPAVDVLVVVTASPLASADLAFLAPAADRVVVVAEREQRGEDELLAIGRVLSPLRVRAGLTLCDASVERALQERRLLAPAPLADRPLQEVTA